MIVTGGGATLIVAESLAVWPPASLQVNLYEYVPGVPGAFSVWLPLVDLEPVQLPLAEHDEASGADHVNVKLAPE